jgi:predicted nucleotidyltransferase
LKVVGLVVEYNPFHNGHLYHLEQSKKISGADCSVCIMSGNFIQRGEPALVNKWARAKMALAAGVDLVLELPVVYAMASAEFFAYGAVSILNSTGIIDYLCFGSESGELEDLKVIADVLVDEPASYKKLLKENLTKGHSYPAARESALSEYFNGCSGFENKTKNIIGLSNNILGIEYLKALKLLSSSITPVTINRISNSYNSETLSGNISSATAIRKNIMNTNENLMAHSVEAALPLSSIGLLKEEFKSGRGPVSSEAYELMLLSTLRQMTVQEISELPYISEGIENRIKEASKISGNMEELIKNITTKRYTRTRIQRTLFSAFTGLTALEFEAFTKGYGPQYIRALGFNKKGRELLSSINSKASLPVIIKTADFKKSCNPLLRRMLEIEAQTTDIYVLGYSNPSFRKAGQEFTQNIIYEKN